jgi:hypothetical protein
MSDPLKSYVDRVLDATDRVLFEEAAACALSGANRSAFIMVWLSCAESLKRRFNSVKARDSAAALIAGEIARKEGLHQSIDHYVLTKSKEYGFVNDAEFTQLNHIYEMRSIYGHPYEKSPSEEELVAAAACVVESVLRRPVRLRHGYLNEQVRLITEERLFLDDHQPAVETYAREVFPRMDETLVEWFVIKLCAATEANFGDKAMAQFVRRAVWFSAEILRCLPTEAVTAWDFRASLTATPAVASAVLACPRLFGLIAAHSQDMVIGNLLERAKVNLSRLKVIEILQDQGLLSARHNHRFSESLSTFDVTDLGASGIALKSYAARLVEVIKKHNWYAQNPALDLLRNQGPDEISKLDAAMQAILGNNVLQAAEGSAGSAISFLQELGSTDVIWPPAFIGGIVAECFVNDTNQIRFKWQRISEGLRTLQTVPTEARTAILDQVVDRIKRGTPKEGYRLSGARTDVLESIAKLRSEDEPIFGCLAVLVPVLEAIDTSETG